MSPQLRLRGFSATQLLAVADQVAAEFGTHVIDLAALAAAAATTTADISGVRIHQSLEGAGQSLHRSILALEPLASHNRELAEVACLVLTELNRDER
ncbi:TetR family transcriptional regulator [Corynebacterium sp. A21]|uniref:TetR family transcriptional regulator n=1 Tax=Corynebacterium sp. A21 TaxID=3457318 RepID=UPI003FD4384C